MADHGYKRPIMFYVGMIALVFTLFTVSLTGGLLARYTTARTDAETAHVAKFKVTEPFSSLSDYIPLALELQTDPEKPRFLAKYTVEITNDSDTAVHCTLTPENMTGNLPLEFEYTELNLAVGQTGTVAVTVKWKDGFTSPEYAGKNDLVRLTLTTEQLD